MVIQIPIPWHANIEHFMISRTAVRVTESGAMDSPKDDPPKELNFHYACIFKNPVIIKGVPLDSMSVYFDRNSNYVAVKYEALRRKKEFKPMQFEDFVRQFHMLSAPVAELTIEELQQREEYARK